MTAPVSFLLVDDLQENLLSLEALLRREGLQLLMAKSGDEALELLLQNDVALALIDVQMPGLNGYELAELMRGNDRTRRVPIIFVTAGTADGQRRFRGYEAGAVDFIQKPIETDILRSKANVFFELALQRQQLSAQRDELEAQAAALREADRRKDEFLATLAHELRTPLSPIRSGLDLLRRNPDGEGAADIRDMMARQLVHLLRLIDDLLDVSRVSEGKIELRKERIKVADVIHSAIEGSRPLLDAARHSLTVRIPPTDLWLEADQTRLSQVVANLLNNAAKYTPEGGRIGVAVEIDGDQVVIDVSDNGVGIAPEMRSKVFQMFAQIDDQMNRAQGGLGIGLALVKQLVSMHGGNVEAISEGAGKGSRFSVRMPLASAPISSVPDPVEIRQPGRTRSLKVLVVDDNALVAHTLGMMLEEMGHEFDVVHDGKDAVPVAKEYLPDVVLLDIGLPGMDGYEVCRAFRQEDIFKTTRIIAQTGWGQDKDKDMAAKAGFDHHLTKPVGLDDLEKLLATMS